MRGQDKGKAHNAPHPFNIKPFKGTQPFFVCLTWRRASTSKGLQGTQTPLLAEREGQEPADRLAPTAPASRFRVCFAGTLLERARMGKKAPEGEGKGERKGYTSRRLLEASMGSKMPLGRAGQEGIDRAGERGQDKDQPGCATLALPNQRLTTRHG
jgi:hypothetical protein